MILTEIAKDKMDTQGTPNPKVTNNTEENINHSSEEDDDNAVDPFVHSLTLTTSQWIQTILLGIILIPIRLVLILFFMLLMWIISSVSLRIVSRGKFAKRYSFKSYKRYWADTLILSKLQYKNIIFQLKRSKRRHQDHQEGDEGWLFDYLLS